jgi:sugar lactone lactonase YvrE
VRVVLLSLLFAVLWASPAHGHDWNGLAQDAQGRLYAIDAEDGRVWRVAQDGSVDVFVEGSEALCHPHHLAFDAEGELWLASG